MFTMFSTYTLVEEKGYTSFHIGNLSILIIVYELVFATSTEETFLQYILENLKRMLENFSKIYKKYCFSAILIYLA